MPFSAFMGGLAPLASDKPVLGGVHRCEAAGFLILRLGLLLFAVGCWWWDRAFVFLWFVGYITVIRIKNKEKLLDFRLLKVLVRRAENTAQQEGFDRQ